MDFDCRANDFGAELVCLLIKWMHRREFLQEATKETKVVISDFKNLRYLRFLLLICFRRNSLRKTARKARFELGFGSNKNLPWLRFPSVRGLGCGAAALRNLQ